MKRISKYEIVSEIGRGGFGVVYKALDPSMNRPVAIKVLELADHEEMLVRFRNEAAAGGNLRHRNITTIYDFGEENGTPFIVMEYLDGHDLEHILYTGQSLPRLQRLEILMQAAEGLNCAHQSGIIHRDVKPANIMVLNDGTVKLMDFGIARLTQGNLGVHTRTGVLVGTVRYMAPEQFEGLNADQRADIWAWGVIGWELFSGEHPFDAEDPANVMYKITTSTLSEMEVDWPDCPPGLIRVLKQAVVRSRDKRFPSFEDVLFDLKPVHRELQRSRASQIIADARTKLLTGQTQEAQKLLRRVLDLDAEHPELAEVRQRLQAELNKQRSSEEASQLLVRADQALAARAYEEAINCLESAQRMAPEKGGILSKLEHARAGQKRLQVSQSLISEAQREFSTNNLSKAFSFATEASQADPANEEAAQMVTTVQAAMHRRQVAAEIQAGLDKARHLLALQEFAEVVALIEGLAAEHGMWPAMQELLDQAKAEQTTLETSLGIDRILDSSRAAMDADQPGKAVELLEELCRRYPSAYSKAEKLLMEARQAVNAANRAAGVHQVLREASELYTQQKYDQAVAVVRRGLVNWPDDKELVKALEGLIGAKAELERAALIKKACEKAEQQRKRGRFREALQYLDRIIPELGTPAELVAIREAVAAEKSEREAAASKQRSGAQPAVPPPPLPEPPTPGPTDSATRMLSGQPPHVEKQGAPQAMPVAAAPKLPPPVPAWNPPAGLDTDASSGFLKNGKLWAAVGGAAVLAIAAWFGFRGRETPTPSDVAHLVAPSAPMRFHFQASSDNMQSQPLRIQTEGGQVEVTIEGETAGIKPRSSSGTAPGDFVVEVRKDAFPSGLNKGALIVHAGKEDMRYPVEILIDAPETAGKDKTNAQPPPPRLSLSQPNIHWAGNAGGQLAKTTIQVSSSSGRIPFEISLPSAAESWLSVTPGSGMAPATLLVSQRQWPPPGQRTAEVRLIAKAPGAGVSNLRIELDVAAPPTRREQSPLTSPVPAPSTKSSAPPERAPEAASAPANPPVSQTPQAPALYGGRTSGRLSWTGSLPPGGTIVVNRDGLVSGPGSATGTGPPSVVPTQVVDVSPAEAKYSVAPFENNPAGKIEIRNTGAAPITFIQLRWRVKQE